MEIYDFLTKVIRSFRKTNKINPLNIRKVVDVKDNEAILLICDTEDGIVSSTEPWIGFKVLVPREVFVASHLPIDERPNFPQLDNLELKIESRLSVLIIDAYREATKNIANK